MSERENRDLPAQRETAAEIEFSAEDLNLPIVRRPASAVSGRPRAAANLRRSRPLLWRWPAFVCAGAASVLAIGAVYRHEAPARPAPVPPPPVVQERLVVAVPEVVAKPQDPKPVTMRNPFDKHEVFEFPPGTSKQEARDAVADLLLQRAMERQTQYDARRAAKRRSH